MSKTGVTKERGGSLQAEGGDNAEGSLLRTLIPPEKGFSISQGFKNNPKPAAGRFVAAGIRCAIQSHFATPEVW